ncbi:hypothetical protein EZ315_00250 [Duncaniella freteri]|uniref:Uncharacterized protein n=1 Tax=Duncaniella freteri TaxID=2530391 RepID=A0A4Z0V4F2_9BACT|nr:hypothetical protein [Duncaniella freteri]TGG39217.1 hypothetical protein EZ315_00250 [Duncaniella freteri]
MTQKEFEERTGLKTDAEEYAAIERMYMSAGSMGKDEFCKRWRQTGKNPLTMALADTATSLNEMLGECRHELIDMREKNIEYGHKNEASNGVNVGRWLNWLTASVMRG